MRRAATPTRTIPLVVLINGYTASASEIVAGAIKDDARGKLIGEKTFGKGVVQNIVPLSNGGGLKYTSGSYYTPRASTSTRSASSRTSRSLTIRRLPTDEVLERGPGRTGPLSRGPLAGFPPLRTPRSRTAKSGKIYEPTPSSVTRKRSSSAAKP